MKTQLARLAVTWGALLLGLGGTGIAAAQGPDHPVITEVYQEPPAGGGPVGRDPADPHQEYIEIDLPPLADLAAGLDKDALNLTFYDVEGDATSPGLALVNYRIDLPTFDLDPSNGLTGLPRPPSGVVLLGWVDYVGVDPPTGLAGTPSSRVTLIDGGITSTTDFTFVAINGGQFSGTTNFPIPASISHLDLKLAGKQGVATKYPMASGGLRDQDFADRGIGNWGEDFHPRNVPLFRFPATRFVQEEETGDEQ